MQWQVYWPNWWKLWPVRHDFTEDFYGHVLGTHYFCLGPFQWKWKSIDNT